MQLGSTVVQLSEPPPPAELLQSTAVDALLQHVLWAHRLGSLVELAQRLTQCLRQNFLLREQKPMMPLVVSTIGRLAPRAQGGDCSAAVVPLQWRLQVYPC